MQISVQKFLIAGAAICCYLTSPYYHGSLRPWIDAKTAGMQKIVDAGMAGLRDHASTLVMAASARRQIQDIESDLAKRDPAMAEAPKKMTNAKTKDYSP